MEMLDSVYRLILKKSPTVPPETGGIIGSVNGIIRYVYFDLSDGILSKALYIPNTIAINRQIDRWNQKGITFCGMFHSHVKAQETFSQSDIEYIQKIMVAVSNDIPMLYFMIVLPGEKIISYKARIIDNKVCISNEEISRII